MTLRKLPVRGNRSVAVTATDERGGREIRCREGGNVFVPK